MISLIAAVDEAWGMGKNNGLLCHLPADLKHFKQITLGKPIIMGRKTFESIGRPLPERLNIVLSTHELSILGATVLPSLGKALALVKDEPEVMVIGGAHLFQQVLPLAQRIYLTVIHHQFDADVYFPKIDEGIWRLSIESHRKNDEKNPYDMTFYQYERR